MTLPDIAGLIKAFDRSSNKRYPLDLVRTAEEDVAGLLTPGGQEIRAYCQLLRALCNMRLTGPSVPTAQIMEDAGGLAAELENHKLALFANWYGACCRLARVAVRGATDDETLLYIASRLEQISHIARVQRMRRLHAVSAATRVECLARMQELPEDFNLLLNEALELLSKVDQSDTRVMERTRLLQQIRDNAVGPGSIAQQLPKIAGTYFALMYKPGDLLTTLPKA
jgi:hypothetical protein